MTALSADERRFLDCLTELEIGIFFAPKGSNGSEFYRDPGWQHSHFSDNKDIIKRFTGVGALCAVPVNRLAVVDVDTKNGGDIAATRALLASLGVEILADVDTPGHGKHFYVPASSEVPSIFSDKDRLGLVDWPGLEILAAGKRNVFLPGTCRPHYEGRGYKINENNLHKLQAASDADILMQGDRLGEWIAQNRAVRVGRARSVLKARDAALAMDGPKQHWNGSALDDRETNYLLSALEGESKQLASTAEGGRNNALFIAAMKMGSYIAGAGLDEALVRQALMEACESNGLARDGWSSCDATLRSGLRLGTQNPRPVPAVRVTGFSDSANAEWLIRNGLGDHHAYVEELGWLSWNGKRWQAGSDVPVIEDVRQRFTSRLLEAIKTGADEEVRRRLNSNLNTARIVATVKLARGMLGARLSDFDAHPELLNVSNGVIDLRTQQLLPHDPNLFLTTISPTDFVPGATHRDWEQAKRALNEETLPFWLAVMGQAITGYASSGTESIFSRAVEKTESRH